MSKRYPSQEMDRFNIRMPIGMRDAIAKRAEENGRSMNSEIVQILEDALKPITSTKINISEDGDRVTLTQNQLNKITVDIRDSLITELNKKFNFIPKNSNK